ncbi:MAG TPA: PAS domain S-box protein [Pyrinomonadaceae bacterium]|nr:PAS domain S-box protein [Pyrinomonadaceae bacterium]
MPDRTSPTGLTNNKTVEEASAELRGSALAPYWLSAIIESADDAIITKTLEGIITSWNNGAERIFGYTAAEAIGQPVLLLIPEDLRDEEPAILARLRKGQRIEHYETVRRRKDGTLVDISLTVSPIRLPDGTIFGASKIARDITERKRAETQRLQVAAIVENSDDAIISKNLDGVILSWNQGAERLYGYTAAEAVGQPVTMLIPEGMPDEEPRILEQIRRGNRVDHYETVRVRKDGTHIDVSLTVSPLKNADGRIFGASKIARDITMRKNAEETRRLLSAIVETSDDAIMSADMELKLTAWNAGAEKMFGYTAEEVLGKEVTILAPPDRVGETKSLFESFTHEPVPQHYETIRRAKDGRLVEVSMTLSPITGEGNQLRGISAVARDISASKRAEATLREQSEIIETVNRVGQTLAGELDQHKLVQAVTDAATEITGAHFGSFFYNVLDERGASFMLYTLSGVPREAFAHFPMPRATDLFGPTFRGEGTILINDVKLDPRYGKNSPYFGMPEGHLPVVSYLAVPVVSRSGEVYGGLFFGDPKVGVFTERAARIVEGLAAQAAVAMDNARLFDAAQRARAEAEQVAEEKQRLYIEAQESSRLKDEFLATVSHELRTPLTAILGWAHMLRTGQFNDESAMKAFETIERNARAQAQLIDDLLDVSRIITGKLRIDVRPIDPNSFIEAAIESVRPAAEAKGVRVQKIVDTGIVTVSGDPVRLQQVVWNLLSNAIKFTPRGGRVQVRLERINSHIEIGVSDSGAGISQEFLPYVFDRFRQADQRTTRQHGGLGLGLAIVRHLVELHGGTVRAESAGKDEGATFTVLLPVAPVYQSAGQEARVHPAARDTLPSYECPDRLDGLSILVVDDEPDTRDLLKVGLGQCGAEVTVVASASEALEAMSVAVPNLLISDIGMPEQDGYELIRRVRELSAEGGGKVPAIALTAYARVEDRMHALRAGYQMHVPKPVELAELVAVAASLVQRGK